jgi:hypothetical protein
MSTAEQKLNKSVIIRTGEITEEVRARSEDAFRQPGETLHHDDLLVMIREVVMLNEKLAERVARLEAVLETTMGLDSKKADMAYAELTAAIRESNRLRANELIVLQVKTRREIPGFGWTPEHQAWLEGIATGSSRSGSR